MARVNSPLVLHDLSDINMTLRAHRWFNCEKVCVACLFVGVCMCVYACLLMIQSLSPFLSFLRVRSYVSVCVSVFQNPSWHAL